jgi:hypothetical protein
VTSSHRRRLPAGFTVSFSPAAELHDEHGAVVARDGDQITLGQTNLDEAAGTFEDPYFAKGLRLSGRCYAFVEG